MRVSLGLLAVGTLTTWLLAGPFGASAGTAPCRSTSCTPSDLGELVARDPGRAAHLARAGRDRAGPAGLVVAGSPGLARGRVRLAGRRWPRRASASSGSIEQVVRRDAGHPPNALRATQTGQLNWNVVGIIGGLVVVLIASDMGRMTMNTAFFWLVIAAACRLAARLPHRARGREPGSRRPRAGGGPLAHVPGVAGHLDPLRAGRARGRGAGPQHVQRRGHPAAAGRDQPAAGGHRAGPGHAGRALLRPVHGRRSGRRKILRHAAGHDRRDDRAGLRRRPVQPVGLVRGDGDLVVPAGRVLPRAAGLAGSRHEVSGAERDRLGAGAAGHRAGAGADRHARTWPRSAMAHAGRLAGAAGGRARCS